MILSLYRTTHFVYINNGYQARCQDFSWGGSFDRLMMWSSDWDQNSDFDSHISTNTSSLIVLKFSKGVDSYKLSCVVTFV